MEETQGQGRGSLALLSFRSLLSLTLSFFLPYRPSSSFFAPSTTMNIASPSIRSSDANRLDYSRQYTQTSSAETLPPVYPPEQSRVHPSSSAISTVKHEYNPGHHPWPDKNTSRHRRNQRHDHSPVPDYELASEAVDSYQPHRPRRRVPSTDSPRASHSSRKIASTSPKSYQHRSYQPPHRSAADQGPPYEGVNTGVLPSQLGSKRRTTKEPSKADREEVRPRTTPDQLTVYPPLNVVVVSE